ncbi:MAG: hypothetical protein H6Q04_3550 [Acidobacteria bacterium]|nr:hypothetical protein [Acidobacteriota bacterium]
MDVLALMNSSGDLISPDPLPSYLLNTAKEVARDLGLAADWLNNGPSRDAGGLFQLGLPEGELETAARWAMTHDVSPAFRMILKDMLRQFGYESVANRI